MQLPTLCIFAVCKWVKSIGRNQVLLLRPTITIRILSLLDINKHFENFPVAALNLAIWPNQHQSNLGAFSVSS